MSVPPGGSSPADNPPPTRGQGGNLAWPSGAVASNGGVPVLSRLAHDRAHLARSLPDPTGGRPVRVLTVDRDVVILRTGQVVSRHVVAD